MLQTLPFRFYHLDIVLKVASKDLRAQCVGPAQELLNLLPRLSELLANCEGLSICLLWEWLHYPMIAFGASWKQVISRGVGEGEPIEKILEVRSCAGSALGKTECALIRWIAFGQCS